MEPESGQQNLMQLAEAIRAACLTAAQQGYERAAADGLCEEGALEVALDAIRSLDLDLVLRELKR
jgi:cation transport regulator ChaB